MSISVFTKQSQTESFRSRQYADIQEKYIKDAQKKFDVYFADTALLNTLISGKQQKKAVEKLTGSPQFFFIYKTVQGFTQLSFWTTQNILPDSSVIYSMDTVHFVQLSNGYYFVQKKSRGNISIISLLPVKWNYAVTNDYLINDFATNAKAGKNFEITDKRNSAAIHTREGNFLFSLKLSNDEKNSKGNNLTIWLRILSLVPLLLFIHFAASHIYLKKGILASTLFLIIILTTLRLLSYFFPIPVNLRQFELFDPAVYGSSIVLRSLGDLLINALLFIWLINFIKNRLEEAGDAVIHRNPKKKWAVFIIGVFTILIVTYFGGNAVRSLVADSQISFDVINFFSLDMYSVTGFIVLCCIAIGYYFFCRLIFFFIKNVFPEFILPFFISIAAGGLLLLSFRIGSLSGAFELYELLWLLLFLLFIKNDTPLFFSTGPFVSRMVFWLFFFSASIASVIITENSRKELRNRQHYAELLATKTDPISEVLLNTILTEFRPDMLASNFHLFSEANASALFRDSLINNNFSGYRDKYDTKVLVFDSTEFPLFNQDPVSYNSINSILNTQAKPTSVNGLYYYDAGYDKFNYISRRVVRDYNNTLLGYVFIIVSPRNFETEMLYPELFSRGRSNSIENSSEYAYAIYDKGRIISSHNDYPFSTRYPEKYFAGKQFLLEKRDSYTELWYKAGTEKYVVIAKENRKIIEMITLISYLFCAFLAGAAVSWFISLLLLSRLKLYRLRNKIRLSIRQQVHGTIIFFSVISFIIIGIATILFFISRYEKNNKEMLSRTIRLMANELKADVTKEMVQTAIFQNARAEAPGEPEKIIKHLSEIHGPDVNLYTTSGDLKASSLPLPYIKGIVSLKMDPLAFYHLQEGKEIQYFQKEHIGKLKFVSDYIPVTDSAGTEIAYLNIPYFTSQTRLKEEISNFLVTIINLNAFIFLIAGIIAIIITNRITHSFSIISEKMKKINLGKRNEAILWKRNDEIGALVKEYNKMLAKLDESAAALARTERESAWQEMAKQVAHEIKNPLTPMKLSMQFLQRSIDNDAPNIKELSAKVSATLVEQIDHLSNIAGEFGRFADIENANPELFDLNGALLSVKQLYEGDAKIDLTWKLAPGPVMIKADKTHINRILTNLIVNGVQAVRPGETPHIIIEETVQDRKVEIKITDNGTGINEEVREKIFTPNFTTKSSGTGLGLAMCKRMAHQAGGEITYVTSSAGTAFFVTLPLVLSDPGEKPTEVNP